MIKITMEYATAEDAILMLSALREKGYDVPTTDGKTKTRPTVVDKGVTKTTIVKDEPQMGKSATTATNAQPETTAVGAGQPSKGAAQETKAGVSSDSSTAVEYPAVSAAITSAVATHGREPVLVLLRDAYGAKSGKDLKPEQYADFLEKLAGIGATADLS